MARCELDYPKEWLLRCAVFLNPPLDPFADLGVRVTGPRELPGVWQPSPFGQAVAFIACAAAELATQNVCLHALRLA